MPKPGTLDQWRTLAAVVDQGGYAQAAELLHRGQSTVSYTVKQLETQLGLELLVLRGRKAVLTDTGRVLLDRARHLLKQAGEISQLAANLNQGREADIVLVVDAAFPTDVLMAVLKRFAAISEGTRVQLREVVLSGADDALASGEADIVIAGHVPGDFLGEHLLDVEFVAVAHPEHPLHHLGRPPGMADLRRELQVVIRDSGLKHSVDHGWLDAEQRWTVTSIDSAVAAIAAGLGFGWLPRHQIGGHIERGDLLPLPLSEGRVYPANLYLVLGKQVDAGPATRQLAELLRENRGAP